MSEKTIVFYPEKPKENSMLTILYYGNLKDSNRLTLEYSFNNFENSLKTKTVEMTKNTDYYFAIIDIEKDPNISLRFQNDNGQIDNNSGLNFQKQLFEIAKPEVKTPEPIKSNVLTYSEPSQEQIPTSLAMVPLKDRGLIYPSKGLRFSYKLNKRIRLILIKLFRKLPSFITGNYRRRINL